MALMVCAGLSSCTNARFAAQPVRTAITSAQGHVTSAQGHVTSAQTHTTSVGRHVDTAATHAKTATTKIGQLEQNLVKDPPNLKLAQEVHGELDALTQELLSAKMDVAQVQQDLSKTQGELKTTQTDLGTAQTKLSEAEKKINAALAAADRQRVKYHRLKVGACTIGAGLVGFVIFHFGRFLAFMGPWAWAVMLGAPALVWGALWFIL